MGARGAPLPHHNLRNSSVPAGPGPLRRTRRPIGQATLEHGDNPWCLETDAWGDGASPSFSRLSCQVAPRQALLMEAVAEHVHRSPNRAGSSRRGSLGADPPARDSVTAEALAEFSVMRDHARRVVAVWSGELQEGRLFGATTGYPEHQDYGVDGLVPFDIH